jgi:hypothetical protein
MFNARNWKMRAITKQQPEINLEMHIPQHLRSWLTSVHIGCGLKSYDVQELNAIRFICGHAAAAVPSAAAVDPAVLATATANDITDRSTAASVSTSMQIETPRLRLCWSPSRLLELDRIPSSCDQRDMGRPLAAAGLSSS